MRSDQKHLGYAAAIISRSTLLLIAFGLSHAALAEPRPRFAAANNSARSAMAGYQHQLEEYLKARAAFEQIAAKYWSEVSEKRRTRFAKRRANEDVRLEDYVLAQPPVYGGPPKPKDPSKPFEPPSKPYIPVVADFLSAAAEHYGFEPKRPRSELEYKRAYARAAAAAGLSKDQAVRIYAFESGGNGTYDVQAGLEFPRPNARAITTALGYNQLLSTNSVELMAEQGDHFVDVLSRSLSRLSGPAKTEMEKKLGVLRRMIAFTRTVPDSWKEHEKLAATPRGRGIHAMVLDVDVGPLLQAQKLLDSVRFAKLKGHHKPLTAAELEMMNLTGDGNGLDMVMMPVAMRARVPTSNFFQRGGYERNPVAIRNNVVEKLFAAINARMDRQAKLPGARELAAAFSQ